jgi:GH43 family beta-xylosidase
VAAVGLAAGLVLAACGSDSVPSTAEGVSATQRPPTQGPQGGPGTEEKLDTINGLLAGKPVFSADFADPFVLDLGDVAYTYATNTREANIPVIRAQGYKVADYLGDALPTIPSWTAKGFIWAPSVFARPDGKFVMYYSALDTAGGGRQCITRAVADSPAGPFVDDSSGPFVCPLDLGGAIDPSVVVVGTSPYLVYKSDGNCCNITTSVWSVPLSSDGLSTAGDPVKLISNDQDWEAGVVEGPSMIADGDKFLLFYSANRWDTADYAIGYAVCDSVTGPCTKADTSPWMSSTAYAKGPGGQEFFNAGGQVWMVYHGWLPGQVDTPGGQRRLYLDEITVADTTPSRIGAERTTAQLVQYALGVVVVVALVIGLVLYVVRRRHHRATAP